MEHPNMMQQNGMQAPNGMNGMQRPQAGNMTQQVHAKIVQDLRNTMNQVPQGWQTTMNPMERAAKIMLLVSSLRILNPDLPKCVSIAENFELTTIVEAQTKEEYLGKMSAKLEQIAQRRASQAGRMAPGQMGMGMNPNMAGMQNPAMAGMNMANGGMGMPNGMNPNFGQGPQQQFPGHLQKQMQPSQIPNGQQPATMDPSALQNSSMPQPMPNMTQGQLQQQPNMNNQAQGNQIGQEVRQTAQTLYNSMPDDQKAKLRQNFMSSLNDQQRAALANNKGDPLMAYFIPKAKALVMSRRQMAQGQQPNGGNMQMNNGQAGQSGNMQQSNQGSGGNVDLSNFLNQQANALKVADTGEQVVPASNNVNFNIGGQMNMSQGINPQMMSNQGNQQGNNPQQVNNQMQFLMMQQEKQQRMQRQNMLAQQQAAQQTAQLRGQPGGLNASGPIQSPAMSMLNRPMMPPGQAAPGTPQQPSLNRPQGAPSTPMTAASQLQQHHQQMLNQNNQQQMNQNPQHEQLMAKRRQAFMAQIPAQMRQRMDGMSNQQIDDFMIKFIQTQQKGSNNAQNQNGMPPGMNMGAPQAGNPQAAFNGGMQNTNAVPGFNAQPPPNQQNQQGQMDPLQFQQRMQQQNQQAALKQRAMDLRPFPRQVLPQLGVNVPQGVNSWGKLKEHISQNIASLQPGTLEKLQSMQNQWFETNQDEMNQAAAMLKQHMALMQRQAQAQNGGVPAGQAPPAQMVPPGAPMGMPNMGVGMNGVHVSPQELQMIRAKLPNAANMTDDQVRNFIIQRKIATNQKMMAQQQQQLQLQQHQQQQQQQQQALRNAQTGQRTQPNGAAQVPPRVPQQPTPNPDMNGQKPGQKRPQTASDDVVEIPNPNSGNPMGAPAMPNGLPPQAMRQQPNWPSQEQLSKMTPQERNVVIQKMQRFEALRKAQQNLNPQSNPQQMLNGQPGAGMGPQGVMPAATMEAQMRAKITALYNEAKSVPKGPAVQYDPASTAQAQQLMKKLWAPLSRVEQSFPHVLRAPPPFGEQRIRDMLKAKVILNQNCANANGDVRDYLAVTLGQLRQMEALTSQYFLDMKSMKEKMDAMRAQQNGAPVGAQAAARANSIAAKGQTTPAASANMAKAPSRQGQRKASTSKPPPAPTEAKTFDWPGAAPSPHGVPKYAGNELTPDKLVLPPVKKRRTGDGSQASTPAQNAGSPTIPPAQKGPVSPDTAKKMQAQQASQQQKLDQEQREAELKKKFKCSDPLCDSSLTGFETETERDKHVEIAHKPVDDPLAFLLEGAAAAAAHVAASDVKVSPTKKVLRPGIKREGATPTPGVKVESNTSTPVGLAPSAAKSKLPPTSAPAEATKETKSPKQKTLRDALEEKIGFDASTLVDLPPFGNLDTKASATNATGSAENDDDFWVNILAQPTNPLDMSDGDNDWIDLGLGDASFSALGPDAWALQPRAADMESEPSLTPSDGSASSTSSSGKSAVSHDSDISLTERMVINLEWDAFGDGDTSVPDVLKTLAINEKAARDLGAVTTKSTTTTDATTKGGDSGATDKTTTEQADDDKSSKTKPNDGDTAMDWSGPAGDKDIFSLDEQMADDEVAADWDLLFGDQAGLTTDPSSAFGGNWTI